MKNKVFIVVCSCFLLGVIVLYFLPNAQKAKISLNNRLMASRINNDTVCFFGDSHIARNNWKKSLSNDKVAKIGVGGLNTKEAFLYLKYIEKLKPEYVLIELGINDLREDYPVWETVRNYGLIIKRLKKYVSQIYIIEIFPVCEDSVITKKAKNRNIISLNKKLKELANSKGVFYIDMQHSFILNKTEVNHNLYSDGLHLNDKGYKIVVNRIMNFVNQDK